MNEKRREWLHEYLQNLESLADKATPGEWIWSVNLEGVNLVEVDERPVGERTRGPGERPKFRALLYPARGFGRERSAATEADMQFIAAARNQMPHLIALMRQLLSEVSEDEDPATSTVFVCCWDHRGIDEFEAVYGTLEAAKAHWRGDTDWKVEDRPDSELYGTVRVWTGDDDGIEHYIFEQIVQ